VGDVRQLPPFTERLQLAASLRDMTDFPGEKQRASLLKARLGPRSYSWRRSVRWLVVEPAPVLDELWRQVAREREETASFPVVRVVDRPVRKRAPGMWEISLQALLEGEPEALRVHAARWLLVESEHLSKIDALLPPALLRYVEEGDVRGQFRRDYVRKRQRLPRPLRDRGHTIRDHTELEDRETKWLRDRDWAGEVVWRETRCHELRFSGRDDEIERLETDLAELVPDEAEPLVAEVSAIGLPSVLETVEKGVGRTRRDSTLTTGMLDSEFRRRNVPLTFQHRMHPEISDFPRDEFYGGKQLEDADTVKRRKPWTYSARWPSRRTWLNIQGRDVHGVNQDEILAMERVLTGFREWADQESDIEQPWSIACLTFYVRQERSIREMLRRFTGQKRETRFQVPGIEIVCGTVDRFQGREADLVLLSFRNTRRVGFLDSVNRLNVAITRGRRQLLVFGNARYFASCRVAELEALVRKTRILPGEDL
jgi:hypothetical protein